MIIILKCRMPPPTHLICKLKCRNHKNNQFNFIPELVLISCHLHRILRNKLVNSIYKLKQLKLHLLQIPHFFQNQVSLHLISILLPKIPSFNTWTNKKSTNKNLIDSSRMNHLQIAISIKLTVNYWKNKIF